MRHPIARSQCAGTAVHRHRNDKTIGRVCQSLLGEPKLWHDEPGAGIVSGVLMRIPMLRSLGEARRPAVGREGLGGRSAGTGTGLSRRWSP